MTGMDLKLRRVAADVKLKDLANAMGVTDSRVSRVEGSRVVTDEAAAKYLDALETFQTVPTSSNAPEAA